MMHGVLGKARHECKMVPGKPYGKWLLWRDKEGWKNNVPTSSICLCLEVDYTCRQKNKITKKLKLTFAYIMRCNVLTL